MSLKVLHVSPTPLVAAPGKLSRALRRAGVDSLWLALSDYPQSGGLNGKFIEDAILKQGAATATLKLLDEFASTADIVHIHNDAPADTVRWLKERNTRAAFVYQVHSPVREGPLYYERADHIGLPFAARLVVGQYQPRHYPDYTPVPNLVVEAPHCSVRLPGERLRVLFSPSHTRQGRWNAKYSEATEKAIRSLEEIGLIEVVWPDKPVSPSELMALRRTCHVSIDEIVTGAFHQVSIEGLCAGNAVINRADFFSRAMMSQCANAPVLPPFVYADDGCIREVLHDLSRDAERTADLQRASHAYFSDYLSPDLLVQRFVGIYETLH